MNRGLGELDVNGIINTIVARAIPGLNVAIDNCAEQARKYVPVRAIFTRTRRGPGFRLRKLGVARSEPTLKQILAAYRRRPLRTAAQFGAFQKSRAPTRRIDTDKGPQYGHNNSERPVIRQKDETLTGNFRKTHGGKLVPVAYSSKIRGGKVETHEAGSVSEAADFLTYKGRYEVKTGRARLRKYDKDSDTINVVRDKAGNEQAGGSLLHSITAIHASTDLSRGRTTGHVTAGGPAAPYARFQEFGTRHNRAQPFLRPALYWSRKDLWQQVKRAVEHPGR